MVAVAGNYQDTLEAAADSPEIVADNSVAGILVELAGIPRDNYKNLSKYKNN